MAVTRLWARLTRLDRAIVLSLLGLCLVGMLRTRSTGPGDWLIVERSGDIVFRARLGSDQSARLSGPIGETLLIVQDGRVRVESSPCRDKVCIGMGAIRFPGELLACVPNRILITIPGVRPEGEVGYDLLSR